jgi:hypothetical protein
VCLVGLPNQLLLLLNKSKTNQIKDNFPSDWRKKDDDANDIHPQWPFHEAATHDLSKVKKREREREQKKISKCNPCNPTS